MNKLIMTRGLPGSGKTTFAKRLVGSGGGTYISADTMLESSKGYLWSLELSIEAHAICRRLLAQAVKRGDSLIVLDNMHLTPDRAAPYVEVARRNGYDIDVVEPNTPWRADLEELLQRGTHRVWRHQMEAYLKTYHEIPTSAFKITLGI